MSKTANKQKIDLKYIIGVAVAVILMFFGNKLVPVWGPMTELGVAMVCVFVGLILCIIISNEPIWSSCLALIAMVLHGYVDANGAIAGFLGTAVILQMIFIFVICSGLRETGAGEVIAKKLLSAKFIQGKPLLFTGFFLLIFLFASIFLSAIGGIIFSYAVLDCIRETLGYDKDDKYIQSLTLGLFINGMIGSSFIPFSGMPLGITNAFNAAMQTYGYSFNPGIYMITVIPVGVLFNIAFAFCIKYVFKCNMSKIKNLDITQLEILNRVSDKFDKKQIIYMVAFLVGVLYTISLLFIPKDAAMGFRSLGQALWFLLIIVVLCVFKIDGKPIMNAKKHFKEGVDWNSVAPVGVFSLLGGALASNDLGFKVWLTEILSPIFGGVSWPVFVFIIVAVCAIVTNFFSNMATGVIVATLTAPFAALFVEKGINVSVIGSAIAYSSMFAYMTYASCGPAPILLGREGITSKFIFTKGLLALPLYIIIGTIIFTVLGYIY